jgi:hypothetical protein
MGPASFYEGTKAAIAIGETAYKGWTWFAKWRYGTVIITHPQNRAIVQPGPVTVEGLHKNAKGKYWLVSPRGDDYRPKCRVNLIHDGTWKEIVRISDIGKPRQYIVALVWVSEFMHSILIDINDRSDRAKYWKPVKMRPPTNHMSVVEAIALNVQYVPNVQ